MARAVSAGPSPFALWQQANGDGDRYRELMREHGHLLSPGDEGYEEASRNLPCGWPGKTSTDVGEWAVWHTPTRGRIS